MTHGEEFRWYVHEGVPVVEPASELDLSNAEQLRECCQSALEAHGPRVVVDLDTCTFLDSTALNVFVGVARQAKAQDGWLRVVSGNSSVVRKLIAITGLEGTLGSYSSLDKALDA